MGVSNTPDAALLDAIRDTFGFDPPQAAGFDSVKTWKLSATARRKLS